MNTKSEICPSNQNYLEVTEVDAFFFVHRTVPKFIRKIKSPDYKDKNVFGVPLLFSVQRTGYPLPRGIVQAMDYLRDNFLDQVLI